MRKKIYAIFFGVLLLSSCAPKLSPCERYARELPYLRIVGQAVDISPASAFNEAQRNAITNFSDSIYSVIQYVAEKQNLQLNDVISRNVRIEDFNQKCTTFSKKQPVVAITCFEYEGDITKMVSYIYEIIGNNVTEHSKAKWHDCENDIKEEIYQKLYSKQ